MNRKTVRIAVLKVRITGNGNSDIWYASRIGEVFYTIPYTKETSSGVQSVLQVVDFDGNHIKREVASRHIRFTDCTILDQKNIPTERLNDIYRSKT